ncbi:protein singed [Pseudomonas sp. SWRI59]|uniref:protein singed n=1 Tax=unclassified Pseudomonas TaxID=196821 RepID=UPI001648955F|nr:MULTISPECIES: protein singed [unclassified Pseudomonas]MBC3503587.1 protein singed [Pseudomonas sp. SWRI59]MBC3507442.1 protein singed [Pseudomonas sp. SWRI68]MDD1958958.1 protein singed [Pseudomonas sp. 39004]MDD2062958.1 protein singed [Pseudomonas sp. 25571]
MATYTTVADVDAILGAGWAPDADKEEAVFEANAYLTSLNLVGIDMADIPDDVKQAGARLSKCASQGKLYVQQTEGSLEAKTVKADSVSTSKSFGSIDKTSTAAQPASVQLALALLKPWRSNPFAFAVKRG